MEINVTIEACPFSTPNYVRTKKVGEDETLSDTSIHVRDIDAQTLHALCDEFKVNVFKKADKELSGANESI